MKKFAKYVSAIVIGLSVFFGGIVTSTQPAHADGWGHNARIFNASSSKYKLLVYKDWGANGPVKGTKTYVLKPGQATPKGVDVDGIWIGPNAKVCYALTTICYKGGAHGRAQKIRGGGYTNWVEWHMISNPA